VKNFQYFICQILTIPILGINLHIWHIFGNLHKELVHQICGTGPVEQNTLPSTLNDILYLCFFAFYIYLFISNVFISLSLYTFT